MQKLTIEIPGNASSKKNSRNAFIMPNGRAMTAPSKAYQKWHRAAKKQLKGAGLEYTGEYPAVMTFYHYRSTNRTFDFGNAGEGIQDLFQELDIIAEDNNLHIIPAIKGLGWEKDAENPRVLVTLESYTDHLKGLK
jgi:hypothetical protein